MSDQQYDNTNRGAIFKNDRKENDNHPDYKGSLNVEGVEYWVSSWIKTSKTGGKFMSVSVTAKDASKAPASKPATKPAASPTGGLESMDDDIPF